MKAFLLVVCSSLLVWPVFAQTICNDPEIKSTFSRAQNPKEYHYYLTETKVCSGTQNPNCNQTNVFLALLRNVSLAAPTDAQTPVMNCGVYNVKYPDLPIVGLGGPIRIAINYRDHSITNHTKSGHSFHPGKVVRKIVQHGSDVYIQSEGSGIGGYKTINDTDGLMAFFWGRIDQRLVKAFEKSPIVNPQPTANLQLIPYRQGRKWGYCDVNKKIIIPCRYDYVTLFSEGLAGVILNDKGFYIDQTGKIAIDNVSDPRPFNKKGSAIVVRSDFVRINRQGEIIQEKYCEWTPALFDPEFFCGLAKVFKQDEKGEKRYGFINEACNLVIPFSYEGADDFSEDLTTVSNGDEKWAWIDKAGKQLTPFENLRYGYFNDGLAVIYQTNAKTFESRGVGYIDHSFRKVILPNKPFSLRRYGDGLFWAEQNGKFGFVDIAGNIKIPFIYTSQNTGEDIYYGSPFKNGVAIVSKNNKLGLINKQGNVVLPIIYDVLEYSKNLNLYVVAKHNQQDNSKTVSGYMSAQGVKYWQE